MTLYDIDTDEGPGLLAVLEAQAAPVESFRITKPAADTVLFASPEGWRPRPCDLPPGTDIAPGAGRIALLIPAEINMHLEPGAPVSLVLQLRDGQSPRHDLPIAFAHPLWSDATEPRLSPSTAPSPATPAAGAALSVQRGRDRPEAASGHDVSRPATTADPAPAEPVAQTPSPDTGRTVDPERETADQTQQPASPDAPDTTSPRTEDAARPDSTSRPILPWLLAASVLLALLIGYLFWQRDTGEPLASNGDPPEVNEQPVPEVAEGPEPRADDRSDPRADGLIARDDQLHLRADQQSARLDLFANDELPPDATLLGCLGPAPRPAGADGTVTVDRAALTSDGPTLWTCRIDPGTGGAPLSSSLSVTAEKVAFTPPRPAPPRITDAEACRRQTYPNRPRPDGSNPPIACDDSVFLQGRDGSSHVIRPLANDLDDAGATGLILQDCQFPDDAPAMAITGDRSITLSDDDPFRSLPLALRFSCSIRDRDGLTDRALLRIILEPRESSGIPPGSDLAPLQQAASRQRAEIVFKSDGLFHAIAPEHGAASARIARGQPGALAHLERRAPDDLRITFPSGLQLRMFASGEPHVMALPQDGGGALRLGDILRDAGRAPEHFQTPERLLAHLRAAWEEPSVHLRLFRDGQFLSADLPLSLFHP